jgi:hypothetical protein
MEIIDLCRIHLLGSAKVRRHCDYVKEKTRRLEAAGRAPIDIVSSL